MLLEKKQIESEDKLYLCGVDNFSEAIFVHHNMPGLHSPILSICTRLPYS
jgi:hypothetical protein